MLARFWRANRHLLLRGLALAALARPLALLSGLFGPGPIGPRFSLRLADVTIPYGGLLLSTVWPGTLIWLLTFALGRVFCAWICPLGLISDLFERVAGRFRPRLPLRLGEPTLRAHHVLFWAAIPYGALANGLPLLVAPDAAWAQLVGLAVFIVPMGLGMLLVNGRVPCRYFCTLNGIGALPSPVSIKRRAERCTGCRRCEQACTMRVRLLEPGNLYDKMYCTRCGLCLDACPQAALSWGLAWTKGVLVETGELGKAGN